MIDQLATSLTQPQYWYLALILAYALGSIPFGLLMGKWFLGVDIRTQGSGNIGMTNVIRSGGKFAGAITFILDFGKGTLVVLAARYLFGGDEAFGLMAGTLAVFGHTRSIFLRFKGGKGVAANFGIWLALDYRIFLVISLSWLLVFVLKRISSLAALVSLVLLPVSAYTWHGNQLLAQVSILLAAYILLLHRQNIARLLSGAEGRL